MWFPITVAEIVLVVNRVVFIPITPCDQSHCAIGYQAASPTDEFSIKRKFT